MEKINIFLRKHSWLFKTGIVFLMIFWATQLGSGIVNKFQEDNASGKKRDYVVEQEAAFKLRSFASSLIEKAKARGEQYSPSEYFMHREEIDCKIEELEKKYGMDVPCAQEYVNELVGLNYANLRKGLFDVGEAQRLGQEYSARGRKTGLINPESIKEFMTIHGWTGLSKVILGWIVTLYLRGILLVLFWYVVAMADWRGILETFLADKLKFLYALVAWPVMIWHYPENVVRKIVVATELRRFGKLFRRFTSEERQKIRDIAQSDDYRDIIATYRKRYQLAFARSFWIALLPALMLYFFVPIADAATDKVKKARDAVIISAQSIQNDNANSSANNLSSSFSPDCEAVWEKLILVSKKYKRLALKDWLNLRQVLPKKIDCIPNFGCEVEAKLMQTS